MMKIVLQNEGVAEDAWLREFIRSTVAAAAWWSRPRIHAVITRLRQTHTDRGEPVVECRLHVGSGRDAIVAVGTHAKAFEAIQDAANALEVALSQEPREPTEQELAA